MAYPATPKTWVAGDVLTAAQLNAELRDALLGAFPAGIAWTSYTPTLTQSAAVTKTVTYAKYIQIGKTVIAEINLTCTGTGTAANTVLVGLPPVAAASPNFTPVGTGYIFDSSVNLIYRAIIDHFSGTFRFLATTSTASAALGADTFTAALASGDEVKLSIAYEAA